MITKNDQISQKTEFRVSLQIFEFLLLQLFLNFYSMIFEF